MDKFTCTKCKKEINYYKGLVYWPFISYEICKDCGKKLSGIIEEKTIKIIKEFVKSEEEPYFERDYP